MSNAGNYMDWSSLIFSILGFLASVLGFSIAILQINKVKKSSEAAFIAAEKTRGQLIKNSVISDMSICTKTIDEIKNFLRQKKTESALLRVNDLKSTLVQLKNFLEIVKDYQMDELKNHLSQLTILRESLEKNLNNPIKDAEIQRYNKILSDLHDYLHECIGKLKYT